MDDYATFDVILLDNIIDLHMSSRGTLVPEEPCYMFYTTKKKQGIKFTEL